MFYSPSTPGHVEAYDQRSHGVSGTRIPRYELGCYPGSETLDTMQDDNNFSSTTSQLSQNADAEKIAELASTADGLYGMTRSCYGSGWFSPSSFQNRNFAIVAKKPKWQ